TTDPQLNSPTQPSDSGHWVPWTGRYYVCLIISPNDGDPSSPWFRKVWRCVLFVLAFVDRPAARALDLVVISAPGIFHFLRLRLDLDRRPWPDTERRPRFAIAPLQWNRDWGTPPLLTIRLAAPGLGDRARYSCV